MDIKKGVSYVLTALGSGIVSVALYRAANKNNSLPLGKLHIVKHDDGSEMLLSITEASCIDNLKTGQTVTLQVVIQKDFDDKKNLA